MSDSKEKVEELLADEEMLTLPDVAERLRIPVSRVHDLLAARKFLAWRRDGVRLVPAAFFNGANVDKHVTGAITLLLDGGFSDTAVFAYLFTPDESLPGRPIDGLKGDLAREVKRRAQALAV